MPGDILILLIFLGVLALFVYPLWGNCELRPDSGCAVPRPGSGSLLRWITHWLFRITLPGAVHPGLPGGLMKFIVTVDTAGLQAVGLPSPLATPKEIQSGLEDSLKYAGWEAYATVELMLVADDFTPAPKK